MWSSKPVSFPLQSAENKQRLGLESKPVHCISGLHVWECYQSQMEILLDIKLVLICRQHAQFFIRKQYILTTLMFH